MTVSATALEMRLKLMRLMEKHRSVQTPCDVPLTEPVDHPIIVSGYASTTDIDLDRTKLHGWAFGFPLMLRELPPLLYKHDAAQPAGKIEALEYDDRGQLLIKARVDHPMAKRCGAFIIAGKVLDYELRDADSPNFYAVIKQAELTEVSLTDAPANPKARVTSRYRPSAHDGFYKAIGEKVRLLVQLTNMMKEQHAHEQRSS